MTDSVFDTPLLTVEESELLHRAKREMEAAHALEISLLRADNEQLRRRNAELVLCRPRQSLIIKHPGAVGDTVAFTVAARLDDYARVSLASPSA